MFPPKPLLHTHFFKEQDNKCFPGEEEKQEIRNLKCYKWKESPCFPHPNCGINLLQQDRSQILTGENSHSWNHLAQVQYFPDNYFPFKRHTGSKNKNKQTTHKLGSQTDLDLNLVCFTQQLSVSFSTCVMDKLMPVLQDYCEDQRKFVQCIKDQGLQEDSSMKLSKLLYIHLLVHSFVHVATLYFSLYYIADVRHSSRYTSDIREKDKYF